MNHFNQSAYTSSKSFKSATEVPEQKAKLQMTQKDNVVFFNSAKYEYSE
jgi:hypothetical protein